MDTTLADGLYRVTTSYLCAGFTVERGRVTSCAPALRRRLAYWMTVAERIGDWHTDPLLCATCGAIAETDADGRTWCTGQEAHRLP